jgi:hypothetical protein
MIYSGSGSCKKFRIRPDPDPQHWIGGTAGTVAKEKVDPSCWFTMASDSERVTRQSADPLNIRPGAPRLDIRRYFYSQRVVDSWNSVPLDIKNQCL